VDKGTTQGCQRGDGEARAAGAPSGARGRRARAGGHANWLRYAPLALLLLLLIAVVASGAWRWLSLDALRDRRAALQAFTRAHPVLSLEVYAGAYLLVVALSLPGALIMSLAGGYLFGAAAGGCAALVGETLGALLMYGAARTALGGRLARRRQAAGRARGRGLMQRIEDGVRDNAVSTLLALRLMPGVPFGLVNLAAGLLRVPVGVYAATTVAGIAPSTFIYCWIGQGLGRVFTRSGAVDVRQLVTPGVYLPVLGLALLAALPLVLKRRRSLAAGAPS
jgi:uncharacterized membrane protein YdjX (TVP38/TMEM64 family)